MAKKTVKRLTELNLQEVSLCAQGMNKNAKIALFKSDGEAQTLADVVSEQIKEKSLADRFTQVWDLTYALHESIRSIVEDDLLKDKQSMLDETLSQFSSAIEEVLPNLVTNLNKSEAQMTIDELKKSLETTQAEIAALKKTNEELAADLEIFKGMGARDKAYYDSLSGDMQKKFGAMSAADRKKTMDAANFQKAEPTQEELLKSLPENLRKMLEDSQKQAAEALQKAQAADDARERTELIAKAEKEFGNVPGKSEEKAEILKHLKSAPESVRNGVETLLKQFQALATRGFVEKGHSQDVDPQSPKEKLNKMAEEVALQKQVSFPTAYDQVIQTAEGHALYTQMRSGAAA